MKTSLAVSLAVLSLSVSGISSAAEPETAPAAPASPHTFTGNVAAVSNYVFRGISQTSGDPAIQGGFDYSHASGFYAGTWASNVSWVTDNIATASNSMELDLYAGYKGSLPADFGYDLGVLTYVYPGSRTDGGTGLKPDSTEIYGALTYKWLTVKYSYSLTELFGWADTGTANGKTKGSGYLDATLSYDMGNGLTLIGHAGHQKINGRSSASYSDYKIGVTKDIGFGVLGLAATSTNADGECSAGQDYCWGIAPGKKTYDAGKSAVFVSFSKTL